MVIRCFRRFRKHHPSIFMILFLQISLGGSVLEDFDTKAKKSLRSDFKKVCASEVRKILRDYENQWLSISTIVEVLRERNIDVSIELLEECVSDLLDRDDMIWERRVDGEMVIGWLGDQS